ncbi:uncharacterized protein EI90DRAFT_3156145 [Cantharellus anzutake]|uniref:uncharacterized protein n=1 Tax=Cantharellus anzutake TaxID=1750568 RepID=UPI0019044E8B|nr:uncharacterized protein EI90DRAFT_3156145 [Cantharellus anzutake]KAF8327600.1 hypothetical protein EI90DRAFT_3156145 [Cantharellus anzutake]
MNAMSDISNLLASISPLLSTLENLIQEISYVPSPVFLAPEDTQRRTLSKNIDPLREHLQQASDIVEKSKTVEMSLRSHYAATLNSLAPIMILPECILLDIFHMAVHSEEGITSNPVDISLVCRHWGTLAASYAMLWTRVHVDATKLYTLENLAVKVRDVPIELDIQRRARGDDSWMYDDEKMPRLGSLRMILAPDYDHFVPFRLLEDGEIDTSDLRALDLHIDRSSFRGFGWETFRIDLTHVNAPSLRSFKIEEFEITSMPDAPFHLTTLSIRWTAMTYEMLHQLLENSPDLEELFIDFLIIVKRDSDSSDAHPITLPLLKRFTLIAGYFEDLRDLLVLLKAPNLESLSITVSVDDDSWDYREYALVLEPFLSVVSTRTLTQLTLFSRNGVVRELIKILNTRYSSRHQNNDGGLEVLNLRVSTSRRDGDNRESRDDLRELVLTLYRYWRPLRELSLSESLAGNEEFRRGLKRWVKILNIDTRRHYAGSDF